MRDEQFQNFIPFDAISDKIAPFVIESSRVIYFSVHSVKFSIQLFDLAINLLMFYFQSETA